MEDHRLTGDPDLFSWLRAQIEARKALAVAACGDPGHPVAWVLESHGGSSAIIRDEYGNVVVYDEGSPVDEEAAHIAANDPRDIIARCEAELAILDACEEAISRGESPEEGGWHDGRDPDERERDEALAELADDILALLADGYRHREGWAQHWVCPACGVALHRLPAGHSWAIPLSGGPWTCSDLKGGPVSPEEFTRDPGQ